LQLLEAPVLLYQRRQGNNDILSDDSILNRIENGWSQVDNNEFHFLRLDLLAGQDHVWF
jgi:hypothetical protein